MPSSTQIFVYMAGSKAEGNYQRTIVQGIDLASVIKHIDDSLLIQKLNSVYKDNICHVWGVKKGKLLTTVWSGIEENDIALAYGNKKIRSYSRILGKVNSKALSMDLWGDDSYPLVFFLDKPNHCEKEILDLSRKEYIAATYRRFSRVSDGYINTIQSELGSVENFLSIIDGEEPPDTSEDSDDKDYPFSQNFESLLEEYCNACTDTPWLKQNEIYKFKFADWVYNKLDIDNQTDEEVLQIFRESQKQAYIPGSNAKGINFVISAGRFEDSFITIKDIKWIREVATLQDVDSKPIQKHSITFPKLSVWLSCVDPVRFKPYATASLLIGLSQIFEIVGNYPKSGYEGLQFANKYLNKLENELRKRPIVNESVVSILCESLNKNELSEANWAWLSEDLLLYVVRNHSEEKKMDRKIWIEKTYVWHTTNGHSTRQSGDRALGKAIWSPTKSTDGKNIYKTMQRVQKDDLVVHLIDNTHIAGVSIVTSDEVEMVKGLPGTKWDESMDCYLYRLDNYIELENHITKKDILSDVYKDKLIQIKDSSEVFYNVNLDLREGAYLTPCIDPLANLLNDIYRSKTGESLPHFDVEKLKKMLGIGELPMKTDIFMSEDEFENILNILRMKKNIILTGPPGVGKTFISEHIAYELIGSRDDESTIEIIQFHQSYSYEDFMQGYRPTETGGFKLKNRVFFNFCEKARKHPEKKFCFIIDEINRGNLSKIFGELMLLIEKDKRGKKVVLTYAESSDDKFSIPENVYLIGTMNTADRSLAMVDYALRRRFGFIPMTPQFDSPKFRDHLLENNVPNTLVNNIIAKLTALNSQISEEKKTLGSGYQIGHSYFCADDSEINYNDKWYENVITYEIKPLLEEYWFDDEDKSKEAVRDLLS